MFLSLVGGSLNGLYYAAQSPDLPLFALAALGWLLRSAPCDDRLMRDSAADILSGVSLMLHATGAKEARVGIEDNKPEAIAAMREAAKAHGAIKIMPVPARYPMGSDRQLIVELTGREVPSDSRAADVGVLVNNVGTAFAVHQALYLGRPLVSRLMTLNGGAMAQPGNYRVLMGTLVSDFVALSGGYRGDPARLIMGGPMMGNVLPHDKVPVVKGTAGILAFSAAERGFIPLSEAR